MTGVRSLTVTLIYQNRKLLDAKPMAYIQNEDQTLYRYAFHLKPEVETASIEWIVMRGDTIIDEGVLTD